MESADYIVIGAGIAGASVAWQLATPDNGGPAASVLLLERESQPGYHTTGRSAALYMATYGTPNIQALTRASRAFYDAPPPEFGPDPILAPRGVVYVAGPDQLEMLQQAYAQARAVSPNVEWLEQGALLAQLPCLKPEAVVAGMSEPGPPTSTYTHCTRATCAGCASAAATCLPAPRSRRCSARTMDGRSRWPMAGC